MYLFMIVDDTISKSEAIMDVIGNRGFSDVIVGRKKLIFYYERAIREIYPKMVLKVINSVYEYNNLLSRLEYEYSEHTKVLHCYANYIISDKDKALLSFQKLKYIEEDYRVVDKGHNVAIMFHSIASYAKFLDKLINKDLTNDAAKDIRKSFSIEGMTNIGLIRNFVQCITGNFDARFFNSLEGDDYLLVKSSTNIKKIKAEYMYYHMLPDNMKTWFVMPFNYKEDSKKASYSMERMHITDIAIKWVHGSIKVDEFEKLMDKFFFFDTRPSKAITEQEYLNISNELYINKVRGRVEKLKTLDQFAVIEAYMKCGCCCKNIDALLDQYLYLKKKVENKIQLKRISVIGHGDPCFANALYNKATSILKFIDPKGALSEEDLWTNPYYDVAKLSHSVCGNYDFFNNGLYDIRINEAFRYELDIDFDNTEYIKIFKKMLSKYGYDYLLVRIYEASLFISMLPLHIDYPHKVLGFILNAEKILEEIEKNV